MLILYLLYIRSQFIAVKYNIIMCMPKFDFCQVLSLIVFLNKGHLPSSYLEKRLILVNIK
jgi:hypothetical protein